MTIPGMAPKAYIWVITRFTAPSEVNDSTADDVIIQALEDALKDGMDIVSFSSGGPAFSGPLDPGALCGNNPGSRPRRRCSARNRATTPSAQSRATFSGFARLQPTIKANGIANGASFDTTQPVAPGSYITIFGTGLSDTTDYATTAILPLAIDCAHVTFDVPSAGISVPGHLVYVSLTRVHLQVPGNCRAKARCRSRCRSTIPTATW